MKFGIYKIFGILVFVFIVSFFKVDLVFSESKYCINSGGYCVEQQFSSPRYVPGECSRDYNVDILGEQACNTFLSNNYSFCLSQTSSCKLKYNVQCDSENGQKFSPNPGGLALCTAAKAHQVIQKYCKCTSDKGVCEEGAKLKSDCDRIVQNSNGQFTQCVVTTIDKNCSTLATSRKFCACATDKSDCGSTIYADKPECDRNKGTVNASYQCIQVENDKGCSSLVDATQNGSQSGGNQGGSTSNLLKELDPQIKGLNKLQGVDNIQQLIGRAISALLGILGSIALVMMLFGGFTWMTSAGNAEKRKKATGIIIWSVLGVSIIFASYAMVNFVLDIFK